MRPIAASGGGANRGFSTALPGGVNRLLRIKKGEGRRERRRQAALPCQERITLDTDHSPFLSRPDELAAALLRLAS